MSQYLLLLHEPTDGFSDFSPQQMQAIIERYQAWSARLGESGKLIDGKKLKEDGRTLEKRDGMVVDGPFSESKEVVGGFFLVEAADYDEAVALCRDCPHLDYGRIELRAVDLA